MDNHICFVKLPYTLYYRGELKLTLPENVRGLSTFIILDVNPSARPPIGGYPLGQAMNMGKLIRFWWSYKINNKYFSSFL